MNSILFTRQLTLGMAYPDNNNNNSVDKKVSVTNRGDKYSLRPRSLRKGEDGEEETAIEAIVKKVRGSNKQKQRAAPLSKYRRKTANARERSRMREINAAFEALRRCVPASVAPSPVPSASEKLTKITTLRLAMKYINALSSALKDNSQNVQPSEMTADFHDLLSDYSDLDCLLLESDGESLPLSDHSLNTVDFSDGFTTDFPENSLSPTFPDHSLSPFEPFFSDFT